MEKLGAKSAALLMHIMNRVERARCVGLWVHIERESHRRQHGRRMPTYTRGNRVVVMSNGIGMKAWDEISVSRKML